MAKSIEKIGIPVVIVCTITSIAQFVGANRITKAVSIMHPLGDPKLSATEEFNFRRSLVLRALGGLEAPVVEQAVF
jgi:glycine reductase complex component B subunit gamma